MFYKLYALVRTVTNMIQRWNEHTTKEAKFMNLFDIIQSSFCGKGHHVTCDSDYMGDIMAQISWNIWRINMVGTTQSNCMDVLMGAYLKANPMKKQTYK